MRGFDLARYLGTWHEIARLPAPFERGCLRARAEYRPLPDGTVEVVNTCYGALRTRTARGRAVPTERPGELLVTFEETPPEVPPAQYVVELHDFDYRWAVVGNDARSALWVLCRAEKMPAPLLFELLGLAGARGYPVDQVVV